LLVELPPSQSGSSSAETVSVDVFANGRKIQPEGPHGDEIERYQQISRIYNLNLAPSETSLVLVVRSIYLPMGHGAYTRFFAGRKLHLGSREDLDRRLELWSSLSLFERLPRLLNAILLTVLTGCWTWSLIGNQKLINEAQEELLVASLSSCHMLSYLHLCAVNGVVVASYEDAASGKMQETASGGGSFARVELNPRVCIAYNSDPAKAEALHEEAFGGKGAE